MGEETNKEEASKKEEGKPKEEEQKPKEEEKPKDGEEKKEEAPPPEELEMRVYMHCEGCARKVKKILNRLDGVEDVIADSRAHKVVVKGKKPAADPMKVVERVQKKTGRKVELLSPIPPPPPSPEEEKKEKPEPPKAEEKEPPVIAVVLKVHMHCEACAQAIKKRILKMKGVQSAESDLKALEVTVKGVFEESKLAEYVHRRTGRHAAVVKSEPVPPPEPAGDDKAKEEKKDGGEEKKEEGKEEEKKEEGGKDGNKEGEAGGGGGDEKEKEGGGDGKEGEDNKEEDPAALAAANLYMHYPRFGFPGGYYYPPPAYVYQPAYPAYYAAPQYAPHAPQLFSDENPNACSVM